MSAKDLESTASLLARVRRGDSKARDRLFRRYLPPFRSWAGGRLPRHCRDLADTDDLVQKTLLRALRNVDRFEPQREGAFLSYLQVILKNLIRDEVKRVANHPARAALPEDHPDERPSPVDRLLVDETLAAYDWAVGQLPERQREAFITRIELGFTHEQVAEALGTSSDAARGLAARALVRMAELMRERKATLGDAS